MWRHRWKTTIYKPRREASEQTNCWHLNLRLPSPWYSDKINFCYLSHLVCATSLWQVWKLIHPQISQQEVTDREVLRWPSFSVLPTTWSIFPLSIIFTWMRFSPFLGKHPACTYRVWQKWSHECVVGSVPQCLPLDKQQFEYFTQNVI